MPRSVLSLQNISICKINKYHRSKKKRLNGVMLCFKRERKYIQLGIFISKLLRIHQRLFNGEISLDSYSFIIKDNITKVHIIRKLVKFSI